MKILAIETSCDETAIAILNIKNTGSNTKAHILANIVHSQIKIHAPYGGVFPSLAKREHSKNIMPILITALKKSRLSAKKKSLSRKNNFSFANKLLEKEPELLAQFLKEIPSIKKPNVDVIAVTYGPGLEPALWVGINFAKALSRAWNIPIIPVNHMDGHIFSALLKAEKKISNFQFLISKQIQNIPPEAAPPRAEKYKIQNIQFPAIALLVSGGHTELVLIKDMLKYKIIGQTRDDAVGEAFDKVARMLSLPYPGGPEIAKCADMFNPSGKRVDISLPRPMLHSDDYDFSFSGLKTAVLYKLQDLKQQKVKLTKNIVAEICREFQEAAIEVLLKKTLDASKKHGAKTILIGGGVSANKALQIRFQQIIKKEIPDSCFLIPDSNFTGDNAAMIATAGYFRWLRDKGVSVKKLVASGNLRLSK